MFHFAEIKKLKGERMATQKMMNNAITLSLVGLVLMSNMVESASRSAPPPNIDCTNLALTMADCWSFVTSGSSVQKPEGSCCSGVKETLKTNAECLCEEFKNSGQLQISLNVTKALTLPAACRLSAPSVSDCGLNVSLKGAPASTPSSAAATPPTSSGPAEVTAPPPRGSSDSSLPAPACFGSLVVGLLACFSLLF